MENFINDYSDLKKSFLNIKNEYRPIPFYHLDGDISDDEEVVSQLTGFKKSGYGGVALLPVRWTTPQYGTEAYYEAYENLLERLKKMNMKAIFCDDQDFPSGWANGELADKYPDAVNKMLVTIEYMCNENEIVHRKIEYGTLMSVVGYEIDFHEVVDLRENIVDGYVNWQTPRGNWCIFQFLCRKNINSKYVNYLNYESSQKFINLTYKRFTEKFSEYIGDVVNMTFYDDIQFNAPNRRSWDDSFNDAFAEEFGFDPAPYYPALFMDIGKETAHIKALMFNCRSRMLNKGFFKAVADFTKAHGLIATGHVAEPKTIASPWLHGDSMLYQKPSGAVGLDLVHAYCYGTNGIKLASSSAYNFDKELVTCEIFGNYNILNKDVMYRNSMNAFSRGVNFMIPHTLWFSGEAKIPHEVSHRNPEFKEMLPAFNDFLARSQTILQGGRHVCDIAILYPIYSLQAQTHLYEEPARGFEFPITPANADFMNLMNVLSNYCCRDYTLLHPETLLERCYSEDGILYLSNDVNFEQYRILIIPGSIMISIKNLRQIEKFFNEGGKIVATMGLPSMAFEYTADENYDDEVNAIIKNIFGICAADVNKFKDYYYNTNDNGGESYYLLTEQTAADGTECVDPVEFNKILESFNIPFDVEISDIPRVGNSGILNLTLPSFMAVTANMGLENNGVFNYIHKKYAGCDIYYFANSTNVDYTGLLSFKGKFTIEEWNPHNGKIKKMQTEYLNIKGEIYSQIDVDIDMIHSLFYICIPNQKL